MFCMGFAIPVNAQIIDSRLLNTAAANATTRLSPGARDTNWLVALGDLSNPNTPFVPSLVVGQCYNTWYQSPFANADWITYDFGKFCDHTGQYDFYYRRKVNLPAVNRCGTPIDQGFCLAMDFYADNFVSEIKVNGVINYTASSNNPYYHYGFRIPESVNLCAGWRPGENIIQVHTKSALPASGFLAQVNLNIINTPYTRVDIERTICFGNTYEGHNKTGIYTDTLWAQNGLDCDSIRVLKLNVLPQKLSLINQTICEGEQFDGYRSSGIFTDTLRSQHNGGCDSIRSIRLQVLPHPVANLEQTICEGEQFEGYAASGVYIDTLFGRAHSGCDSIRTIRLTVLPVDLQIYVPNAFSPEATGLNARFQPFLSSPTLQNYRFSVFDRWGTHLFSTSSPGDCWDGTYHGKPCAPGVYTYFLFTRLESCRKTFLRKGDVTLIR